MSYNSAKKSQNVVVVASHIQRIGCQPETSTMCDGQSGSWCIQLGKDNKNTVVFDVGKASPTVRVDIC